MCWSANVSWVFGCLDLFFLATIFYQKSVATTTATATISTRFHGTYAAFLACIAAQEWAQYLVWKRDNFDPSSPEYCRKPIDFFLSITVLASAQSVPVVLMLSHVLSSSSSGNLYYGQLDSNPSSLNHSLSSKTTVVPATSLARSSLSSQGWLWQAVVSWSLQLAIILVCMALSQQYCIQKGPHNHQVWVCASSVYETGGYPLYFASLALYIYSAACSLCAHSTLPRQEKEWIIAIGLANGIIAYGLYCWTLEACSIWCWAAFTYGIYFCTKDSWLILPSSYVTYFS